MTQIKTKLTGVLRIMLMTTHARVDEHQRQTDALFRDLKAFEWWQVIVENVDKLQASKVSKYGMFTLK